jgi:hypothetical protein
VGRSWNGEAANDRSSSVASSIQQAHPVAPLGRFHFLFPGAKDTINVFKLFAGFAMTSPYLNC